MTLADPGRVDVPTGRDPYGVSVDPVLRHVYVGNSGEGTLTVLDADTGNVLAKLALPCRGSGRSAVDHVTHKVYVANHDCGRVTVVDGMTLVVLANVVVTGTYDPVGIAVDPLAKKAYVTNYYRRSIGVIDTVTDRLVNIIPVAGSPDSVAVDPARGRWYVGLRGQAVLGFASGGSSPQCTVSLATGENDIAVDLTTGWVYVASVTSRVVVSVSAQPALCSALLAAPVPGPTAGIAVDSASLRVYATLYTMDRVVMLFAGSVAPVWMKAVGDAPVGIATDGAKVYTANIRAGTVTVVAA